MYLTYKVIHGSIHDNQVKGCNPLKADMTMHKLGCPTNQVDPFCIWFNFPMKLITCLFIVILKENPQSLLKNWPNKESIHNYTRADNM